MRQFLAVTVLLALVSLPAAFFLGGIPASAVNTVNVAGAAGADKGAAVVAALQQVAAGLAASLAGTEEKGGPLHVTAGTVGEDAPAMVRIDPAPAGAAEITARSVVGMPDHVPPLARVAGAGGAAIAHNRGIWGLARDYPTAFLWFVLA